MARTPANRARGQPWRSGVSPPCSVENRRFFEQSLHPRMMLRRGIECRHERRPLLAVEPDPGAFSQDLLRGCERTFDHELADGRLPLARGFLQHALGFGGNADVELVRAL